MSKRIMFVINELHIGGAEKHVVFLSKALNRLGYKVCVLKLFSGGELEKSLQEDNIQSYKAYSGLNYFKKYLSIKLVDLAAKLIISFNVENLFTRKDDLRNPSINTLSLNIEKSFSISEDKKESSVKKFIRDFNPDVIHIHTWYCKKVIKWAFECSVKKIVYTHHNIISVRHNKADIDILGSYLKNASNIIFISEAQKADFLKNISFPENQTQIIPPISGFEGISKEIVNDRFVIGTLSNLAPVKGVIFLLDAINILKNKNINVYLKIAGGNVYYNSKLKKECRKLELTKYVSFSGCLEKPDVLQDFYHSLDCFVLPSISEGLSLVIIEAMSSCKPVIASNVDAIPGLVDNDITGYLIEPRNPVEIAKKIEYLYFNRDQARRMGNSGFEKYRTYYSNEKVIEKYLALYNSI